MSLLGNSTTRFNCPVFTELHRDADEGVYSCEYVLWFYGVAATLLCVGGLLPIILLICCWAKWKNTKSSRGRLQRQDSDASTHTDLSRPRDHGVYEIMRDDHGKELFYRTSKKGLLPKHYGTFSAPDLKAWDDRGSTRIYPDITPIDSSNSHSSIGPDPQPKTESVPNTLPSCMKRSRADRIVTERIDSYLKGVADSRNYKTVQAKGISNENINESTESLSRDSRRALKTSHSPEQDGLHMKADSCGTKEIPISNASPPGATAGQSSCEKDDVSYQPSFQPTPPMKHLVDRVDFDQYLAECVSKLPEDQKNGTFLIRDSQSNEACKVLTIYFKDQDPVNTLYHFKVCFNQDFHAYISGTNELFDNLEALVEFYRKQRSILPCLLLNCLGKSF